jgi:hypothetical protein
LFLVVAGWSFAQTANFRVEELVVPPSQITTTKCVQVGIFMDYTGPTANWAHYEASLTYTLPDDAFLAGAPFVNVTDFAIPAKAGITDPGQVMTNDGGTTTPCAAVDIINSATLGGPDINLMEGAGGTPGIVTESVVVGVSGGTIDITSLTLVNSSFTTEDGQSYLMAIIEFPLATGQGTGQIDIEFDPAPAGNFLSDGNPANDVIPTLENGFVQVFETINCGDGSNFAVFDDAIGAGSASTQNGNASISLDYLDPVFGGTGAEMDVTVNFGNGVIAYQIVGSDGYDSGQVAVVGPGTDNLTINPDPNQNNTYDLTFFVLGLDGVTPVQGSACTLTQSFNAASCTATWVNNGITATNSTYTVTLTNAFPVGGTFATVSAPAGAAPLPADLIIDDATQLTGTSGSTATILLIDEPIPNGTWAGSWDVTGLTAPGFTENSGGFDKESNGRGGVNCNDTLGFTCPTNNATVDEVTINSAITVNLIGSDELSWTVTYNGVTTSGISSDDATFVTPNLATANANTITVTAEGVGPDGLPCPDTQVITLDYAAPTCDSATQNPDSTVTPVDVGTVITLILVTSGAVEAEIDGVPMTLVSGTLGVSNTLTWEATHVAVADTVIDAVISNPDDPAETATCSWSIDINCIDPVIYDVAPVGENGITVFGTPFCIYTLRLTSHIDGTVTLYDVEADENGYAVLNIVVPPDVWIEVGQQGIAIVTDSTFTVPTLGEWGLIAFITLLMAGGVYFMRRRRLA